MNNIILKRLLRHNPAIWIFVITLAPLLLLSACVTGSASENDITIESIAKACPQGESCVVGESVEGGASLTGNFLSGDHAQSINDLSKAADFLDTALKLSPQTPDLLRRTFILMAVEGRMDKAIPLARRVIAITPDASIANMLLAVAAIKDGRYADAEKRMSGPPKKGINIYIAPLVDAWSKVGLGKPAEDSIKALEALNGDNGSKALHNLHSALISDIAGDVDRAEKSYKEAVKSQGGLSLRLAQLFGGFLERRGKTKEAKAIYLKYLKAHPDSRILEQALLRIKNGKKPVIEVATAVDGSAEGLFGIAGSLSQQNARETALVLGRMALYLKPDFTVMQILVADILESNNRLKMANQIYSTIKNDSPFSWAARLNAAFNMDELGETEAAIKQLEDMANADLTQTQPLVNLGNILSKYERFPEAVKAYNEAILRIGKLQPKHWAILYSRGIALERSKQWPLAEADFLKALTFKPEQPFVLNYLGYSWVDQGVNLKRAKGMIKKAVNLRPGDGYIVDSLGWALYRLGDYKEAVVEMERAVELRPQDAVINDHLGDTYWKVGRKQEARFQWRRALSLAPEADLRSVIEIKIKKGLSKKDAGDV